MKLVLQLIERYQVGGIADQEERQFLERCNGVQVMAGGDIPIEHIIVQGPQQRQLRVFERIRDPAHLQVCIQGRIQSPLVGCGHALQVRSRLTTELEKFAEGERKQFDGYIPPGQTGAQFAAEQGSIRSGDVEFETHLHKSADEVLPTGNILNLVDDDNLAFSKQLQQSLVQVVSVFCLE